MPALSSKGVNQFTTHHCPHKKKGNCRHANGYCTVHQTKCTKHGEGMNFVHLQTEPCKVCESEANFQIEVKVKAENKAREKAADEAFRAKQQAPKPGQKGYRKASGKENNEPGDDKKKKRYAI
ncbi:hypothetical protein F5Y18DRAFT_424355 [Xylariaceae sp. FL1019]|nr:hypothetical protein F5Y18DRAFT_424355 [Xylariaceae sp. FL1019]